MPTRRAVLGAVLAAPVAGGVAACASDSPRPAASSSTVTTTAGARVRFMDGVSASVRASTPGEVDAAMSRVRQVWDGVFAEQQPRREVFGAAVIVTVPATQREFTAAGGGTGAEVAATTRSDGVVVLSPGLLTKVPPAGRIQVMAHEFTHVALHSQISPNAKWLVEGPPEWTGYHGTALTTAQIAPQLAVAVRAGRADDGPPGDDAFAAADLQAAYQSAYTWIAFLLQHFGQQRVLRFVIDQTPQAKEQLAGAFQARFGTSIESLATAYHDFQHTAFGGPAGSA